MQFRAKSAKNDFKSTNFLKCNFYFEIQGVPISIMIVHIQTVWNFDDFLWAT